MRLWHFLKKYRAEIAAFFDLELFAWAISRRYLRTPPNETARIIWDAVIMFCAITLLLLARHLTKKWREQAKEQVRALSRRLLRRLSEQMLRLLEKWQRRRGRGEGDLLGGRTRIEYDLFGNRGRKKKNRRAAWKQLESERERIRWLYAGMIEERLKHGAHIRASETPEQIARHEDTTPEQTELIGLYEDCRYDPRRETPSGKAQRWKDNWG